MTIMITDGELATATDDLMAAVEASQIFIVTRDGRPIGALGPIGRLGPAGRAPITIDELRARLGRIPGLPSAAELRAEIDAVFGEERLDD